MDGVQLSHQIEAWLGCAPLVRVNGKAPLDRGWTSGPRRDPDEWREGLIDHCGNVGVVTGEGIFAVDIDLYAPGAEDSIDALYDMGLPRETVTVLTGGGGRHLYYRTTIPVRSRP